MRIFKNAIEITKEVSRYDTTVYKLNYLIGDFIYIASDFPFNHTFIKLGTVTGVNYSSILSAISAIPTNPLLNTDSRLNTLDATISSRLAASAYIAPDNADILLIKAKTDNLPVDPASTTNVTTSTSTLAGDITVVNNNVLTDIALTTAGL